MRRPHTNGTGKPNDDAEGTLPCVQPDGRNAFVHFKGLEERRRIIEIISRVGGDLDVVRFGPLGERREYGQ